MLNDEDRLTIQKIVYDSIAVGALLRSLNSS